MLARLIVRTVRLVAFALCAAAPGAHAQEAPALRVFAAASLREVLEELAGLHARATGRRILPVYAGSSALARQVEAGAPADVFVSADGEWMDHLARRNLIQAATRADLAGNALVLIAPAGSAATFRLGVDRALAPLLLDRRLALADPAHVPAGRYARAALTHLGLWESVKDRLAPAENVRAALMLVARREAPLGVVYRTDARAEPKVRVLDTFPPASHPKIVYPAAVIASSRQPAAAAGLVSWLRQPAAVEVFARHGFVPVP